MITSLHSLLMHHVYDYYTSLLAELSDDITIGVICEITPSLDQETESINETPQGLSEWTTDNVV